MASAGRVPKRSQHRVSGGQEGRSERPGDRDRQPRAPGMAASLLYSRARRPPTTMPDIPSLAARLTDPDPAARLAAAEQLAQSGEAAAPAAALLVKACGDADDLVREQAVAALEELGPPPAAVIADLIPLVAATDPLSAYWAITLLGRSGQAAAAAVAALTEPLGAAAPPEVAQRAAWALGKIGPAAAAAANALRTAAASADPRLARLAGEALAAAGG